MDITRRVFIGGVGIVTLTISGCGYGNDDDEDIVILGNHPSPIDHTLTLARRDISGADAAAGTTLFLQGNAGHRHELPLSDKNVADLLAGQSVVVFSKDAPRDDDGVQHSHEVHINRFNA